MHVDIHRHMHIIVIVMTVVAVRAVIFENSKRALKTQHWTWGFSSSVEFLENMHEVLGSIHSTV